MFQMLEIQDPRFIENSTCSSVLIPHVSAFTPCFLSWSLIAFSALYFVAGNVQIAQLIRRKIYGSFSLRSVGFWQFLRVVLVFGQSALYFVIFARILADGHYSFFSAKVFSYLISSLVVFLTLLPLHVLEVQRSIWQTGTLLTYWFFNLFVQLALVYQNNFTEYPQFTDAILLNASTVVAVNSVVLFALESFLWTRALEYTHHLKLNEVDINSLENSNLFARITFQNLNPLIQKSYDLGTVEFSDLPKLPSDLSTQYAFKKLAKTWDVQLQKKNPSVFSACFRAFGWQIAISALLEVLQILFNFVQPQLLRLFMGYFMTDDEPVLKGVLLALSMTGVSFIIIMLWNEYINQLYNVSYRIRLSLTTLVYEKSLKLSSSARTERNVGDIINLISVDITKVEYMVTKLQTFLSAPLQFVLCLLSLYSLLGLTSFSGLGVVLFALPVNLIAIKKIEYYYDKNMKYKDLRTKCVSEILNSIKSIKLYSWETPMKDKVNDIRNNKDLRTLRIIGVLDGILNFSWSCVPYFVSCATFGVFAYFGNRKLTSDIIFPALALFDLLGDPLFEIPDVISAMVEAKVSVGRLTKFLIDEELDERFIKELEQAKRGDAAVAIKDTSFQRKSKSEAAPALSDITFTAKKGELTCIVGSVGSGKTTFLQSILGQLPATSDAAQVEIRGKIAYCSQQPWVMNASIKKNILFGHKYDPEFFEKTIEACELKSDFEILPDGEETEVGEKGISLSGGQKARVSLARAVYARADIYLLDDVLSAVDAHVGKNIINKVLSKETGILASKTLILSTNHIHVLEEADEIYVLDHGKISEQGTYSKLKDADGEFSKLIKEFGKQQEAEEQAEAAASHPEEDQPTEELEVQETSSNEVVDIIEDIAEDEDLDLGRTQSHFTLRRASAASYAHKFNANLNEKSDKEKKKTGQTTEVSKKGKVSSSTYLRYARAATWTGVAVGVGAIVVSGIIDCASKLWLKHWAEINDANEGNTGTFFLISVYTLLGVLSGAAILLEGLALWYFSAINASKSIHEALIESILQSPMSFFETTPTGRILNRFSEDISKVDERFPHCVAFFLRNLVKGAYTLGMIAFTLPSTIFFIVVLSFVYYNVQKYYIAASRDTKRFASVSRSPVYSHIQETLVGVDTIKAYKEEDRFKYINRANLDYSLAAGISQLWMTRWLNVRLKTIGSTFLLAVSLSAVSSSSKLSAGIIGLLITFSFQITDCLNWLVRMSVEVETNAVAVERVFEYCDLPSEKPYVIENSRPPVQWPMKGGIKFADYTTRYNPEHDPVLKDISFEVKPREKIGIVGRTGAGKSTLTLALFRIIESYGGAILIDDVDTSKIGLYDLRSKLNIIPQDSQAFEGTVRQNLDPFHKFKDEEIWKVLELAHLKDHVETMKDEVKKKDDGEEEAEDSEEEQSENEASTVAADDVGKGLYAKVTESGSNLSAGQKQLLCLARALLNPSKILILDEATAAVDVKTDKIVQETIRKEFADKTILTIAHRIDTILDNDKILVLDRGEVKEFDSPENLLKDKSTIFYSLCERGGYLKKSEK